MNEQVRRAVKLGVVGLSMLMLISVPASKARADSEGPAVEAARSWLGALREKDGSRLKVATGFPFTEAGIGPGNGKCGKRAKAANAAEFDSALNCMLLDADFVGAIGSQLEAKVVSLKALATPTFKKNMKSLQPLAKDHTFVTVPLTGDGLAWEVLLAVKKGAAVTLVLAEPRAE